MNFCVVNLRVQLCYYRKRDMSVTEKHAKLFRKLNIVNIALPITQAMAT